MAARREDWPERLHGVIAAARERPFAFGSHDCCLFACDCVLAMTDEDPAAWFRGQYENAETAADAMRRFAGGGLVETAEAITGHMQMPEVAITHAQRGDVVLAERADGWALGIVDFDGMSALFAAPVGLVRLPLSAPARAWRV